jgi:hypothetical protein
MPVLLIAVHCAVQVYGDSLIGCSSLRCMQPAQGITRVGPGVQRDPALGTGCKSVSSTLFHECTSLLEPSAFMFDHVRVNSEAITIHSLTRAGGRRQEAGVLVRPNLLE